MHDNMSIEEIIAASKWETEMNYLRKIILNSELEECIKWGQPTYTINNSNVLLLYSTKNYCAITFFEGAILNDPDNLLFQQTENVQASRLLIFRSMEDIKHLENELKHFMLMAIDNAKAGIKVPLNKSKHVDIIDELEVKYQEIDGLQEAFESLTPGRQRAYILFFSGAKKTETRTNRIEKWIPHILEHKGMNDR